MCKLHVIAIAVLVLGGAACKPETSISRLPVSRRGHQAHLRVVRSSVFLADNCQTCHGQSSSDRKGAPSGYDFGTIEEVRAREPRIFARAAADNVTMPPGPDDPPAGERYKLAEWLACGAP